MSCELLRPSFVIRGAHVGWPEASSAGVCVVDGVLQLATSAAAVHSISSADIDRVVMPPWLCRDGTGGMLVVDEERVIRRVVRCGGGDGEISVVTLGAARAVAARGDAVALLDGDGTRVMIFTAGLGRLVRSIDLTQLGEADIIGWSGPNELIALSTEHGAMSILSASDGVTSGPHRDELFSIVERIGYAALGEPPASSESPSCTPTVTTVVAVPIGDDWWHVRTIDHNGVVDCFPHDPADISTCLACPVATTSTSFDFGSIFGACWLDRHGRPVMQPTPPMVHQREGELQLRPIDAGRDDVEWSRLRLDADVPEGGSITVQVLSHRVPAAAPDDRRWTTLPLGAHDATIRQPPGRYLSVRFLLSGDGIRSPLLRRLQIDMDTPNTIDQLPAVYQADPLAADFLRRFLAIADAEFELVDHEYRESARLLDPGDADHQRLMELCELVGIDPEPEWSDRSIARLLSTPHLLNALGTPEAVQTAVQMLLGDDVWVSVEEAASAARRWVTLDEHGHQLGARLASRATSSTTLGQSVVGAQLRDSAELEIELHNAGAFVVNVHVGGASDIDPDLVARTTRQFVPAHIQVNVRIARGRPSLGQWMLVGVDTAIQHLPSMRLASCSSTAPPPAHPSSRLGQVLVGAGAGGATVTVGRRSRVGLTAIVR